MLARHSSTPVDLHHGRHAGCLHLARPHAGTGLRPSRRCRPTLIEAAKRKKGPKEGGAAPANGNGGGGGGGGGGKLKSPGEVRGGAAYSQETRKTILTLGRVSKMAPSGKKLLNKVSLGMYLGAKIGVLGANGSGKSTLMRILAGKDTAFDGDLQLSPGIRVGLLEQEPELDGGATVGENIQQGVAEVKGMVADYEAVSAKMAEPDADIEQLSTQMDELQARIDACNGWEIDRAVDQAMDSLRCPPPEALVENLSGGERRRVALCRLLLSSPDILLLDEPTNHLDAESVAWLERFLAGFRGTVVAVTHDRYFLDNVAGWILELDRGAGIPFEGNYSEWLAAKDKRLSMEERQQEGVKRAIAGELEWMSSNAKGQQKKGKARLRRYDDLMQQASEYVRNSKVDSITIPVGPRLGDIVLTANQVVKAFGERVLVEGLDFDVPPGAVVGIIGGNGAGKSTLFRMVMGQDSPDGGSLTLGETVVPMYVDQSRATLDAEKTVFEDITDGAEEIDLNGAKVSSRAYCSWYNFKGGDQQKKVGVLSGGERNRLHLAKTLRQAGNLLLLDEPTNDLDVDTLRCLEDAILNFAGSVLIISHDRWFLDRVATHILAFEGDSRVSWFEGGYSEYEAHRREAVGGGGPTRMKFRQLAAM